ncbi:MAG TPA: carboxypeptidase regulatory-like domain-containing protein, partial [Jatrophihabitantaceae bacterium]|nr:carboxypeptidase regulatory-like domain-containing protein [Jatrophihabitantaceae bacterium]
MTKLKRGRAAAALIAVLIIAAGATATQPPASAVSGTALSAIAGTVTDAAGHPLRHVLVNAESWVSIGSGPSAWTDAQGHYLVHSGPGDFTMTVRAGRATGGNSDATGYYEAARFQVIRVKAGRVRAGVDLRLRPAAAISGRVTDSYEYRLSGVLPYLRPALAYAGDDLGLADDDELSGTYRPSHRGRFRITGVAPGAYQLCFQAAYRRVTGGVADDTGYDGRCVPGAISVVSGTVTRSGTAALQVLRGGGVLAGTVRGFDAAALKGVTVTARQHRSEASAVTDRNGRYAIHALAARPTRVCFQLDSVTSANATGYAPQCLPGKVQVRARQVQHASVTLAPGAAIGGTVTGADGTALAGAPVEILHGMGGYEGPSVDSDDSGHYAVKNLAPGGQYDACTDTDFSTAAGRGDPTGGAPRCYQDTHDAFQLKPGVMTSGIDLKLEAAGGVRGRVVDKHGRPIRGVEIELEGPSQFGNEGEFYAVTDAHGRYSAVDLPPAKYEACFSNRYFYEQCYPHTNLRHAARITVPAGKFVNGIDAALDNTAPPSVRVTAVNRSGQPLAGVDAALFKGCPETNDACAKQPLLGGPARMVVSEDTGTNGHATLAPYRPGT